MAKISIQNSDKGWILEAIARRWRAELCEAGHDVTIDEYGTDNGSETFIHFIANNTRPFPNALNIAFVTHLNFPWKIRNCVALFRAGVVFLCISKQTKAFLTRLLPGASIFSITLESLHFAKTAERRKIVFGLFFRLYDDNRKSNESIQGVIDTVANHHDVAHLIIYGAGFEAILRKRRHSQAVTYDSTTFDPRTYERYLRACDYVLYFGRDEGAMSVLDASMLGVRVLATDQGFHRDIPLPIGSMLFKDAADICAAVTNLIESQHADVSDYSLARVVAEAQARRCGLLKYWLLLIRSMFLERPVSPD